MDVSREPGGTAITIDDRSVALPATLWSFRVVGDALVLCLSTNDAVDHEPDVLHPGTPRNLVALDRAGEQIWTVEADPDQEPSAYYRRVYRFHDRCLCRRADETWAEIDPATGAVVETLPGSQVRVGGRVRAFPNEVTRFHTFADVGMVVESVGRDFYNAPITAFDPEENELWRREFLSTWLFERDGKLLSMTEASMGATVYYGHDPATGEPTAIDSAFTDDPDVLRTYVPPDKHHLVDEYVEGRDGGDGARDSR